MKDKFVRLRILLLVCTLILCGCRNNSDSDDLEATQKQAEGSGPAVITYVINFSHMDEEPVTFRIAVTEDGKAIIPPDLDTVEDAIWSGWLTEDGELFDFETKVSEDMTLSCVYSPDENNNGIPDRTPEDPVTIYQFYHANGFVMQSEIFFGKDVAFNYTDSAYSYPTSDGDGQVFLGWLSNRTESEDSAVVTYALTPNLAPDRNNNDLADGSQEDPYVYYVFLMEDGTTLLEIEWLSGEKTVRIEDVTYPGVTKDHFLGWVESVSTNEDGYSVHTYTPNLVKNESANNE